MKKSFLIGIFVFTSMFSFSQTNTFPTTGSVGIGIANPLSSYKLSLSETGTGTRMAFLQGQIADEAIIEYHSSKQLRFQHWQSGAWIKSIMALDISSGNVGIGTTNPYQPLHIVSGSRHHQLRLQGTNGKHSWIQFYPSGNGVQNWQLGANTNGFSIYDVSNSKYNLTIANSGDIGIGTSSPESKLHVKASSLGELTNDKSLLSTIEGSVVGNNSKFQILNKRNSNGANWSNTSLRLQRVIDVTPQAFIDFGIEGKNSNYGLAFGTRNGYSGTQQTRMVIEGNGNIGVGITNPGAKLEVSNEIRLRLATNNTDKNVARIVPLGVSGITGAMNWSIRGAYQYVTGINSNAIGGDLDLIKSWNGNTILATKTDGTVLGNVGIGTTTPDAKLAVNGNIHAKEVKIDLTGWPDYVFESDYNLPTLKEVENHIAEKGHLHNIPSAAEVSENGILVGDMNAKLLQKIEELTLYMIEQNKKTENLIKEVNALKAKNTALEKKMK